MEEIVANARSFRNGAWGTLFKFGDGDIPNLCREKSRC